MQQIAAPFFVTVLLSILPAVCFAMLLTGGAGILFGAVVNNTQQAGSYELKLLQCCAQGSTIAAAPANHQQMTCSALPSGAALYPVADRCSNMTANVAAVRSTSRYRILSSVFVF